MAADTFPGSGEEFNCESLERHEGHICQLLTRVSAGEIIDMFDLPGFVCANCRREANSAEYLCRPRSLEETA